MSIRAILLIVATVIVALIIVIAFGINPFKKDEPSLDTTTHSFEVAGFYAKGDFTGELLESDTIVTNITDTGMSQSIVFRGVVCSRIPGLGLVFLDGAKLTEPDARYNVYINGFLQFSSSMEVGSASPLNGCIVLAEREYVLTGQTIGSVKVDLSVYVFSFQQGAGAYSVLASDVAKLT